MEKGINGEREMRVYSETTKKWYEAEEVCRYINPKQSAWMMNNGCELVDVFPDNEKMIFSFYEVDHRRLHPIWIERKAKENG